MKIEKCPDAEAFMVFSVSSSCINITSGSETMSMMSGVMGADVMSIDSGPETEFNFQDIDKTSKQGGIRGRMKDMGGEEDDPSSLYGGKPKLSLKRASSAVGDKQRKLVGPGGAPIPRLPTLKLNNKKPEILEKNIDDLDNILEHVDEENYTSRVSDLANVEASEEHIQSVPPVSGQNKLKIFKIDKSKIKMSNKEEVTSSQSKIKLKLNNIKNTTTKH